MHQLKVVICFVFPSLELGVSPNFFNLKNNINITILQYYNIIILPVVITLTSRPYLNALKRVKMTSKRRSLLKM